MKQNKLNKINNVRLVSARDGDEDESGENMKRKNVSTPTYADVVSGNLLNQHNNKITMTESTG